MRARVSGCTRLSLCRARLTVPSVTPAERATSNMVGRFFIRARIFQRGPKCKSYSGVWMKKFTIQNFVKLWLGLSSGLQGAALGVNIDLPERGGSYADLAMENYRWNSLESGRELKRSECDEAGWPKVDAAFVVDWRPVAEWAQEIDDPEAYRISFAGTYRCSFRGSAKVGSGAEGRVENLRQLSGGLTAFDFVLPPG